MSGGDRLPMEDVAQRVRELAVLAGRRGESLPSEPSLVAALGISRPSLREILARLESEGLIRRRQGAVTIVNPGAADVSARIDQHQDHLERLRLAGYHATMEIVESGPVSLGPTEARALGVAQSTPALRTVRRWCADGTPAIVAVELVPIAEPTAVDLNTVDVRSSTVDLVDLLRGDVIEWELAWPGAEVASSAVRSWLGTSRRLAVLTLEIVGVGRSGQRCYRASEYHVPAMARFGLIRSVRDAS